MTTKKVTKKSKSESNSYFIDRFKVKATELNFVKFLLKDNLGEYNADTYKFFCHVLANNLLKLKYQEFWVSIPSKTIEREAINTQMDQLISTGLIDRDDSYMHTKDLSYCRKYKVNDVIVEAFLNLPLNVEEDNYNLMTGVLANAASKLNLHKENGVRLPKLVREAREHITTGLFNRKSIELHLNYLKRVYLSLPEGSKERYSALCRYKHDERAFMNMMSQEAKHLGNNIYTYILDYNTCYTGRQYQEAGSFQNASRRFKSAALVGIENIFNYDIKGSQPNCLILQLNNAGISCPWLVDYLNDPNGKYSLSKKVGISVDSWKGCVYAVFFGANLLHTTEKNIRDEYLDIKRIEAENLLRPKNDQLVKRKPSAILKHLLLNTNDVDELCRLFIKLKEELKPLCKAIKLWQKWLIDVYVPANTFITGGKKVIRGYASDLDYSVYVAKKEGHARNSCISSFVLQNMEAAYILELTKLSNKYNFKVVSWEHDGIITISEVPEEAKLEAMNASGFITAVLEEKALESLEVVNKIYQDSLLEEHTLEEDCVLKLDEATGEVTYINLDELYNREMLKDMLSR